MRGCVKHALQPQYVFLQPSISISSGVPAHVAQDGGPRAVQVRQRGLLRVGGGARRGGGELPRRRVEGGQEAAGGRAVAGREIGAAIGHLRYNCK